MAEPERQTIKPTDLRGILEYIPLFRDQTFVISVDGSIVEHENFANLMLDLAVLQSLHIRVVLVHGIGRQVKRMAAAQRIEPSDPYGQGPTDDATLALSREAAAEVSERLMRGLTRSRLKFAQTNAIRATEAGVVRGVDQQHTGKVDRIDGKLLRTLLAEEVVPLFSPIAFDRQGAPLRLNSDLLASELAIALEASKLIYLVPHPGLTVGGEFLMNVPVENVATILAEQGDAIDERVRSKARYAVKTIEAGVPRAHLIDGRVFEGLITEIFSKVGIGTMIHGNAYQEIRPAEAKDLRAIHQIVQKAASDDALRGLTLETIEARLEQFFVYEIDGSLIGCAALIPYPGSNLMEISSVYVQPFYQGKGVGAKLVGYAVERAKTRGATQVFLLTTQSYRFFKQACGFDDAERELLPPPRREELEKSGRNSRILAKTV